MNAIVSRFSAGLAAGLVAALAVGVPGMALADTTQCRASVQNANGTATGWVEADGDSIKPVRATFAFPAAAVSMGVGSEDYALVTPAKLPAGTVFVTTHYAFTAKDGGMNIQLDQAEIHGPAFTPPGGAIGQPVLFVATSDASVLREDALEADGALSLRLLSSPGTSTRGDTHVSEAQMKTYLEAFTTAPVVVIAAGDLAAGSAIIYRTAITMIDQETRKTMITAALQQATADLSAGKPCEQ